MAKAKTSGRKLQECWGILSFFGAVFLFLCLISYDHLDPSFFTQTRRIPLNYGGRVGANIAEISIQLLGLSSYIFCIQLFFLAVALFQGSRPAQLFRGISWQLTSVFAFATFLGLQVSTVSLGGASISAGGMLGGWLSTQLLHYLNIWGATLFTLCLLLISLVFSTPLSMVSLLKASLWVAHSLGSATRYILAVSQKYRAEKLIVEKLTKSRQKKKPEIAAPKPAPEIAIQKIEIAPETSVNSSEETEPEKTKKAKKPRTVAPKASEGPLHYTLPSIELLKEGQASKAEIDRDKLLENSKLLETKLTDFGIEGAVVAVRPGPVITMYEFKPGPGVKISQIAALADDLSLALSAQSVRIVAPIPGKSVVGIEIPNDEREKVVLREILATEEFQKNNEGIPLAVGKDISGSPVTTDLARMPHLLIAGAPGAGKSVFVNSLVCSLLYKFTPHDLRLIMVDPKQLELNLYEDIPHLLLPIVDDPKKASTALKWAVNEMERRYKIMAKSGVRNLAGFNEKLQKEGMLKMRGVLCPEKEDGMPDPTSLAHLFDHDESGKPVVEHLPFILIIIDEFADLMMVAPKDIETNVARLAQKARAAGIHLVIATQRPSVDVITGLIKANLPSRISFKVASKVDSRTILDSVGAEKLLGQGDMLFSPPGLSKIVRLHGAFVTEEEIEKLRDHWCSQAAPVYKEEILDDVDEDSDGDDTPDGAGDALYDEALGIVRDVGQASASMLQRRLKVGYNRAARMIEAMEAQGIVGPADGAKPREVLL